jgi:hypothetical protein
MVVGYSVGFRPSRREHSIPGGGVSPLASKASDNKPKTSSLSEIFGLSAYYPWGGSSENTLYRPAWSTNLGKC